MKYKIELIFKIWRNIRYYFKLKIFSHQCTQIKTICQDPQARNSETKTALLWDPRLSNQDKVNVTNLCRINLLISRMPWDKPSKSSQVSIEIDQIHNFWEILLEKTQNPYNSLICFRQTLLGL